MGSEMCIRDRPYAVGAAVVDGWALQSVQGRRATLVRNGLDMVLDLPALGVKGKMAP